MKIIDLRADAMEQAARLLIESFAAWPTMESAMEEVRETLTPDHISRIAVEDESVIGWIGGASIYRGNVWELQPLVVRADRRLRGVGRALVADLEHEVAKRGAHTIFLGTDDEDDRTSLGGVDVYPDVLTKLSAIENVGDHPFGFYQKVGYVIVGVVPDANGFGKPDILMAKRVGLS